MEGEWWIAPKTGLPDSLNCGSLRQCQLIAVRFREGAGPKFGALPNGTKPTIDHSGS